MAMSRTKTRRPAAKTTQPKSVDDYLAAAPQDERAALCYKQGGQRLVHFGYWKDHIALYGTGSRFLRSARNGQTSVASTSVSLSKDAFMPDSIGLWSAASRTSFDGYTTVAVQVVRPSLSVSTIVLTVAS